MFHIFNLRLGSSLPAALLGAFALGFVAPASAEFDIPKSVERDDKASTHFRGGATRNTAVFKDGVTDEAADHQQGVADKAASTADESASKTVDSATAAPPAQPRCSTGNCCGVRCDCARITAARNKIPAGHKPLFYDNDLSYLKDPCYTDRCCNDRFKHFCWKGTTIETGGQTRFRFHNEQNMRGLGFTGNDDQFLLMRQRLYLNLGAYTQHPILR